MTRKSLCVIKSETLVRMRGNPPPGHKTTFSVPRARVLEIFQNNLLDSNLGRSSDECMAICMLKPMAQCQILALISRTRNMLIFRRSTLLGHMIDVNADVNHILYFVLAT